VEVEVGRLADNFRELAESVSARTKVDCRFECVGAPPKLEVLVATHLYRIAQEAIANAVEHGGAKRVDIRLVSVNDEVVLTVMDNGSGDPENFKDQGSLGWQLMKYRADLIGAVFNLGSGGDSGTWVTCTLPHGSGTEAMI
jgi:two-component system sensor kinase FixL